MRTVERRRPCSSRITISWVARVRPRLSAVQVPVTTPDVAERLWVALISMPTANRPGPAWMAEEMDPRVSPSTT